MFSKFSNLDNKRLNESTLTVALVLKNLYSNFDLICDLDLDLTCSQTIMTADAGGRLLLLSTLMGSTRKTI